MRAGGDVCQIEVCKLHGIIPHDFTPKSVARRHNVPSKVRPWNTMRFLSHLAFAPDEPVQE